MAPAAGLESHGFDFTWSAVPTAGDCAAFGVDHYRLVLKQGAAYPFNPGDGSPSDHGSSTSATVLPHRAERTYKARIFACDNADCSDKFGDGAGETIAAGAGNDDLDQDTTEAEQWLIVGLDDNDPGLPTTAVPVGANDPGTIVYPSGFTYANTVAIYAFNGSAGYLHVTYSRADTSGWLNFNTATWTGYGEVVGNHTSDDNYNSVSHPYLLPLTDGANEYIGLLAQNMGSSGYMHVVSAESTDDVGDDFDLTCATCCAGAASTECDWPAAETAGTAGVAVCADGTATCYQLADALHGRWMWNYIGDPAPDLATDEPSILFSGDPDNVDCAQVGGGESDIYKADWDATAQAWVVYDGADAGSCPDALITDAHDPGIFPLPGGDFKVYVVDSNHDVTTYYWDGSEFEYFTAQPKILWDDGLATEVDSDCIANVDIFGLVESGVPHEGMFMYIAESATTFEGFACGQGTDYSAGTASRIFFAELQN